MIERMSHQEYVASVRTEMLVLVRAMLNGSLSFLEGAVRVSKLMPDAELPTGDPDFDTLTLISSETEALPLGLARSQEILHIINSKSEATKNSGRQIR